MKLEWTDGNRFALLESGEAFFPAVFAAIETAAHEVIVETFILFDDAVGRELQATLIRAAQRGARVDLTVDGYGSHDLPADFAAALIEAGVRLHVFDPQPKRFGMRMNWMRRLHRKIVVVDGRVAFVGGINYAEDQLTSSGPDGKLDFSVRIEGPLAAPIQRFASQALAPTRRRWWRGRVRQPSPPAAAEAMLDAGHGAFVIRDNHRHRDDIERCYRMAIRTARHEVLIANAYFFPGYRLLREMRRAARRGVRVSLILQGQPDMAYVRLAASLLYDSLIKDGVEIHEYTERPLHGKVAVIDGVLSTIGSSNLDPLSLSLNLEANVLVRDTGFAEALRVRLIDLIQHHCQAIRPEDLPRHTMWRYIVGAVAFHVARRFPVWLPGIPLQEPKIESLGGGSGRRRGFDGAAVEGLR